MMLVWVILMAVSQVSTSVSVHNISRRSVEYSKCFGCQRGLCPDKFELIHGHTACFKQSPIAKPVVLSRNDKNDILDYHNLLRASVSPTAGNMLQLHWDNELELLAQRWADACKKDDNGIFYHDTIKFIPGRFEVGQNIASGFETFRQVIDAWNIENATYQSYIGHTVVTPKLIGRVGHHTQIAWAKTGLLGCATTVCENTPVYVCNYAPPGNVLPFLTPYEVSSIRGKRCANSTPNGLCDCNGLVCENAGTLDVTTCTCKCRFPTSAGPKCGMDCSNGDYGMCGKDLHTDTCQTPWTNYACPHMCGHCPCVASNYHPLYCSVNKSVSLNYDPDKADKVICLIALQLIIWVTLN